MSECPVCESAATDVQMAKAALKAARDEMERQLSNCDERLEQKDRVIDKMEERYRLLEESYRGVVLDNKRMKSDREFVV